jgi:hypothetical protein
MAVTVNFPSLTGIGRDPNRDPFSTVTNRHAQTAFCPDCLNAKSFQEGHRPERNGLFIAYQPGAFQ